ncbi:hypothetical protein [Legionella qingyii]|uniref:hypothetical protein n=1 Tax=Legionella qingyii TaxID=2184757 RepID=UPI0013155892|nr:hypothetical protein [Legionella qingyii]
MKKTTHLDRDYFLSQLILLADKMISDCYSGQKSSEEIKRNFFIGVQRLRAEL